MDARTRELMEQYAKERRYLLPILEKIQEAEGCLSEDAIKEIGHYLDLSINDVYSVATFYKRFSFAPVEGAGEAAPVVTCDAAPRIGEVRIALRNAGRIDPEKINDYKGKDGYAGIAKALKMSSDEVIEETAKSGLRGRGGAGFPAADKWRACKDAEGE